MSIPVSNQIEASRCDWAAEEWGWCIRQPRHPGRNHVVIDCNGDLLKVPGGIRSQGYKAQIEYGDSDGRFTPLSKDYFWN